MELIEGSETSANHNRTPLHPALEDGTDRGFRNVGKPQSDAEEIPKRIHTRSLHDLTPDRKIIRNRLTLKAGNYAHNITNYAVNNKSLSTLTPRYYRYTPLYSRVRLQQNPHHHPPLRDTHTHAHTTHPTRPRLPVAAAALRTALQHAAYEWGNSAPAIVPDRRAKRRCGLLGKLSREIASLRRIVDCGCCRQAQLCLPACVSLPGRNTMCATGEECLHAPPFFFPSGRIAACPNYRIFR